MIENTEKDYNRFVSLNLIVVGDTLNIIYQMLNKNHWKIKTNYIKSLYTELQQTPELI